METDNIELCTSTISNGLKQLKITLKCATINLDRLNAASTVEQRKIYAMNYAQHAPQSREKIIFIDESGFNYHLRRTKARSRINTAAHVVVPTVRGRNVSLIAAMNINEVVYHKIIGNSSVNTNIFCEFLQELFTKLQTLSITNAWLVLDNARIHKTQEVRELVDQSGHHLVFLSPYSPMLNPIEKIFSKTKLSARNMLSEQSNGNLLNIIQQSIETIIATDCNNYYLDMSMKLPLAAAGQTLQ